MISIAASLAPPCLAPRRAPMAPVMQEYISDKVPAITRPVKVEALNSCSAYNTNEVFMASMCNWLGALPCKTCKKCAAMLSSLVLTSTRLPLWLKWYQYSRIEPKQAIKRSPKSWAATVFRSATSGSKVPSMAQPVRITSIGWVSLGICSSTVLSAAGNSRNFFSLAW